MNWLVSHQPQYSQFFQNWWRWNFDVVIRVIDGDEPLLTLAESKLVKVVGQTVIIQVPSGNSVVDELGGLNYKKHTVMQGLVPGNYKACAYLLYLANKFHFMLCKTDKPAQNNIKELNCLFN